MEERIILETRDLHKEYRDGSRVLEVLRGVDLAVKEGEILAIRGPSGSGKSTLLHILGLLDRPTRGELFLEGKPVPKLSAASASRMRNRTIGFVFQFFHLLPELNALENVRLPGAMGSRQGYRPSVRARQLLERVGLGQRLRHRPAKLSGGERQRVALARALLNDPALVLCDEPTGNLDSASRRGVVDLIRALREEHQQTFVIATHDDRMSEAADRIVELEDGRIK